MLASGVAAPVVPAAYFSSAKVPAERVVLTYTSPVLSAAIPSTTSLEGVENELVFPGYDARYRTICEFVGI